MKKIKMLDEKFRGDWKHYVFQSACATVTIFIAMLFLRLHNVVVVAALGATTFIVFTMPSALTARPRNIIGGYLVGFMCGALFSFIPHDTVFSVNAVLALAVGCSIFVMVLTNTEHPPASAIALAVAVEGVSLRVTLITLLSIVILVLIHRFFKRHLRDLI